MIILGGFHFPIFLANDAGVKCPKPLGSLFNSRNSEAALSLRYEANVWQLFLRRELSMCANLKVNLIFLVPFLKIEVSDCSLKQKYY